jgi:hypothetical protein
MKSYAFLVFTFFLTVTSSAFALSTKPIRGKLINYGSLKMSAISIEVFYESHGHLEGAVYTADVKARVHKDGSFTIPSFQIDPDPTHTNSYAVMYSLPNMSDIQGPFFYCAEDQKDYEKDLNTISAYTFAGKKLTIAYPGGMSAATWMAKYTGFQTLTQVWTDFPSNFDLQHDCLKNPEFWAHCQMGSDCAIDPAAVLLTGEDFGSHPTFNYNIQSAWTGSLDYDPTAQDLIGVTGVTVSEPWSGTLPQTLINLNITGPQ